MRRAALVLLLLSACWDDPQKGSWGFDAIKTMKTPADPMPSCVPGWPVGGPPSADLDAKRGSCTFGTGATAEASLGIDSTMRGALPIRHVIIAMRENRAFDHLLHSLHDLEPAVDAVPDDYANPDLKGDSVKPFHADTTCLSPDPGHQSHSMKVGFDDGKMDGWVKNAAQTTSTDGHYVMGYYEPADLPFDYWLASTWALNQRHFAPVVSGTYANRNFMLFGDNAGAVDTGIVFPSPATPSIFQTLIANGFTWGVYADEIPLSGSLDWSTKDPGVKPVQALYDDLDHGTLPNVVFVDGLDSVDDDHPTADLHKGEAAVKRLYDHVIASPQWPLIAMIWVYDEGGGFPDHVRPNEGCKSSPGSPFTQRGPRVPFAVISPWARKGFVSSVEQDHTAITRFVETVFGLPALTARDANSPALLDLFDFSCPGPASLDAPAAPDAGTGMCANPP